MPRPQTIQGKNGRLIRGGVAGALGVPGAERVAHHGGVRRLLHANPKEGREQRDRSGYWSRQWNREAYGSQVRSSTRTRTLISA